MIPTFSLTTRLRTPASHARLAQLDVRDINKLVHQWKMYEALRPGTLVLVCTNLSYFTIKGDKESIKHKKVL